MNDKNGFYVFAKTFATISFILMCVCFMVILVFMDSHRKGLSAAYTIVMYSQWFLYIVCPLISASFVLYLLALVNKDEEKTPKRAIN